VNKNDDDKLTLDRLFFGFSACPEQLGGVFSAFRKLEKGCHTEYAYRTENTRKIMLSTNCSGLLGVISAVRDRHNSRKLSQYHTFEFLSMPIELYSAALKKVLCHLPK
jgi:hypothetical protein